MEFLFKKENIEKIHIENIGNPKIIASTKISSINENPSLLNFK